MVTFSFLSSLSSFNALKSAPDFLIKQRMPQSHLEVTAMREYCKNKHWYVCNIFFSHKLLSSWNQHWQSYLILKGMGKRIPVSSVTFIPSVLLSMLRERNMLSFLFEKVMCSESMNGKHCYDFLAKLDSQCQFQVLEI